MNTTNDYRPMTNGGRAALGPMQRYTALGALLVPVLTVALLMASLRQAGAAPLFQGGELPVLGNASFECTNGLTGQTDAISQTVYIPNGWVWTPISGTPVISSTQLFFGDACAGDNLYERIDGIDSLVVRAQDIETPPQPGKPFDVSFHQPVTVLTDTAYSLSAWMLSLCGGSAVPSDCPDGYYMAKMLGMDPTGGPDPLADTVAWVENRNNFVTTDNQRIGWSNLYTAATAQSITMTVFARIRSPFRWHGNHAFIDAFSLVRAPTAELVLSDTVPLTGSVLLPDALVIDDNLLDVGWRGEQSPDVATIEGGSYQLLFDVQYRALETDAWTDIVRDHVGAGCRVFTTTTADTAYQFRVRPRAEQLTEGVLPNHRYPGVWSEPVTVFFRAGPLAPVGGVGGNALYLPLTVKNAVPGAPGVIIGQACATAS